MELAKGNGVCARGELAGGAQQIDRPYHQAKLAQPVPKIGDSARPAPRAAILLTVLGVLAEFECELTRARRGAVPNMRR
jgi:hypothetical protein